MLLHSLRPLRVFSFIIFVASFFMVSCALDAVPQDWVVVYDIPTVLQVNQQTIRGDVPGCVKNGISYTISKWTTKPSEAIENDFRNLLTSLGKQQGSPELLVRDPEGRVVSKILAEWLAGVQPASSLIQCISNYAEYDIFKDIAKTVFNGAIIAKHTNAVPHVAACVEQCAQLLGADHIYLIGNWDPSSFIILARLSQVQSLFAHIPPQNRFISGLTHLLLPRDATAIFNLIATSAHVPLDHIIFVSHMPYHLSAAQRLGVATVAVSQNAASTMQNVLTFVNR